MSAPHAQSVGGLMYSVSCYKHVCVCACGFDKVVSFLEENLEIQKVLSRL